MIAEPDQTRCSGHLGWFWPAQRVYLNTAVALCCQNNMQVLFLQSGATHSHYGLRHDQSSADFKV